MARSCVFWYRSNLQSSWQGIGKVKIADARRLRRERRSPALQRRFRDGRSHHVFFNRRGLVFWQEQFLHFFWDLRIVNIFCAFTIHRIVRSISLSRCRSSRVSFGILVFILFRSEFFSNPFFFRHGIIFLVPFDPARGVVFLAGEGVPVGVAVWGIHAILILSRMERLLRRCTMQRVS